MILQFASKKLNPITLVTQPPKVKTILPYNAIIEVNTPFIRTL